MQDRIWRGDAARYIFSDIAMEPATEQRFVCGGNSQVKGE